MKTSLSFNSARQMGSHRGSVLVTALVFAAALAVSIGSYLLLSTNSLKLAHRTFIADSAVNLAETGLEEAVYSFNKMGNSTVASVVDTAWTGWTRINSLADAYMTSTGTGYTSAPTVSITGGNGSGATGTANITTAYFDGGTTLSTRVTSITITNPGTGYTSVPTISLSGGGGSGAAAVARFAATKTITFNNLDGGATGVVKVWVAGYNGTAVVPTVVSKAIVTPLGRRPVEKIVKVVLSKNGILPKGVVAFNGINWNGHPLADSFKSSTTAGVPSFALYNPATALSNTTVASLAGTIDLSQGSVDGNVLTGPGVTVVGHGDISGQTIGNFSFPFTMPTAPVVSYKWLGSTVPAVLPKLTGTPPYDTPINDPTTGLPTYYYETNNVNIGALTVTAGYNVVIKGTNTNIGAGMVLAVSGSNVATAKFFIDGTVSLSGNGKINAVAAPNSNWAGSLEIYTTTTSACTFAGNGAFYGCLTAPYAELRGNGGGSDTVDLCGSFVVGSVTSNGHMSFHYDEGLGATSSTRAWGLSLWKEMQSTSDRAVYARNFNF